MSTAFAIGMVWKSAVIAAAVLALLTLMRRQSATHRAAVAAAGLTVLALLPLLAFGAGLLPVPSFEVAAPTIATPILAPEATALSGTPASVPPTASAEPLPWMSILTALWAFGAVWVLARLAAGLATLQRWTGSADELFAHRWGLLMRRCGAPQGSRLLVSDEVAAPLSWGWLRPVILVHRDLLSRPDQAEAVIAHESAHLHRLDWPRLLAARLVVALFWFNPLVWILERKHQQDVEEAADAEATTRIDPAQYAETLLNVARGATAPIGANSMASGSLYKRISRVLERRAPSRWERTWRSAALAGTAAIATAVAATQFAAPMVDEAIAATPESPPPAVQAPAAPTAPAVRLVSVAKGGAVDPLAPAATPVSIQAVGAAPSAPSPAVRASADSATAAAERAAAQAERAAQEAIKVAERAQAEGLAAMRKGLAAGADGMVAGAENMRRGAAQMREEARKLRDPAYRARLIREAQANQGRTIVHSGSASSSRSSSFTINGRIPTDKELIEAIPQLEKGAADMEKGALDMLKGAEEMRRSAARS